MVALGIPVRRVGAEIKNGSVTHGHPECAGWPPACAGGTCCQLAATCRQGYHLPGSRPLPDRDNEGRQQGLPPAPDCRLTTHDSRPPPSGTCGDAPMVPATPGWASRRGSRGPPPAWTPLPRASEGFRHLHAALASVDRRPRTHVHPGDPRRGPASGGEVAPLRYAASSNPRSTCSQSASGAGARGSGEARTPRCSRIRRTTAGSVIVAIRRIFPLHLGHTKTRKPDGPLHHQRPVEAPRAGEQLAVLQTPRGRDSDQGRSATGTSDTSPTPALTASMLREQLVAVLARDHQGPPHRWPPKG